jgi:hypothetical protein
VSTSFVGYFGGELPDLIVVLHLEVWHASKEVSVNQLLLHQLSFRGQEVVYITAAIVLLNISYLPKVVERLMREVCGVGR